MWRFWEREAIARLAAPLLDSSIFPLKDDVAYLQPPIAADVMDPCFCLQVPCIISSLFLGTLFVREDAICLSPLTIPFVSL